MRSRIGFQAVFLAVLCAAVLAVAQEYTLHEKLGVSVSATTVNQFDGTHLVIWHLNPPENWHLYSDRLNDTGFPPALTLHWPEAWSAGPLLWPVAERHVMTGGILDHVYPGPVTLLQEVRVPAESLAEGDVALAARWDWLVCREICVPGNTPAEVVFSSSESSPLALALLADVRSELPVPAPAGYLKHAWTETAVTLSAGDAVRMEFHPDTDCVRLVDAIADGARDGDTLTLRLRPAPATHGPLRGVLHLKRSDGCTENWSVDIPYGG